MGKRRKLSVRRRAMKTLRRIISAAAVLLLLAVVPTISAENNIMNGQQPPQKDYCMLLTLNCQDNAYVLQQRIDRLQGEISKGNAVYTDPELNMLRKKLDDTYKALDFVINEGA
jgi:hypothetical protein